MAESLRILILEDNHTDAELAQFELQEAGFAFNAKVVMTEKDFVNELQKLPPHLILSDYDLPQYNGALALAEAKRKCPDTPFVLVSGAVSEDRAIEILTQGAKDYVLKNRLRQRLVPAVRRALAEADEHRTRKQAEEDLRETHRMLEERVKIRTEELEAEIAAREKTEEELRKSEARFKAQYQGNPMPTFTWRMKEGTFFLGDYNEAAKIFTNGEVIKYINKKADEMYRERPDVLEGLHRCYAKKTILQKEFKSEHFMPGRIIATTFAFVPPDLVMVHAGDITERKQAEETLLRNEELYRNVFRNHAAVKLLIDPDTGGIIEANEAAVNYYGWSHEQLKQMTIQEINVLSPKDLKKESEKACFNRRIPFEFQHRRSDGLIRDVEVLSSKIEVNGKDILHSIVNDVTDRKQAEESRRKMMVELREALSQVKTLGGVLPICASCKKIRDDKGYWNQIESYLKKHSDAEFSHSICPECTEKLYPDLYERIQ
jgi:PAS domain S-box-containing protein